MTLTVDGIAPALRDRVEVLFAQLTRDEKASMLAGVDDWHLRGIPRLGLPSIRVTDCGHGVSLCGDRASPATCFPTGIGMASTWNVDLMEAVGHVIGRETRALGCSIMLGPKINLHRHPLNGRSFETFSEDPLLAGTLGAAVIRGIQAEGVGACVKAVAANNQQHEQGKVSSEVDERTLRELYLRNFEVAIELGKPCMIMTSYNRLNGPYTSESPWLLKQVIKQDWGFPGLIVSDWRAVHSTAVYNSGLDLEMPGPGTLYKTQAVLKALDEGLLDQADVDDAVRRQLAVILAYGQDDHMASDRSTVLDTAEHRAVAEAVAEESIVLLKNEADCLPLQAGSLRSLLVVGPNAATARLGGGGSASVTPFFSISPLEGIREVCGDRIAITHLEGCSLLGEMEAIQGCLFHLDAAGQRQPGLRTDFYNGTAIQGTPAASLVLPHLDHSWGWASPCDGIIKGPFTLRSHGLLIPPTSGRYRIGVQAQEGGLILHLDDEAAITAWDDEGGNYEARYRTRLFTIERDWQAGVPVRITLDYGKRAARAGIRLEWQIPNQTSPIDRAITAARNADAVIICTGLSNIFEGGAQDRQNIDLPDSQRALIEGIAAVNPRTIVVLNNGGPLAMPWEPLVPALVEAWYPGQAGGRALARVLFGQVNPSGRLPDTLAHRLEDHRSMRNYPGNGSQVRYEEGLAVGYRHFDQAEVAPHYPFGFGLSYTTFSIATPQATIDAIGNGTVSTRVKNTGRVAGKDVVQLYIRPIAPKISRPLRELRGFRKVDLKPGASVEVSIPLVARDFAWFDPERGSWRVDAGRYEILVGSHSRSLVGTVVSISADHEIRLGRSYSA